MRNCAMVILNNIKNYRMRVFVAKDIYIGRLSCNEKSFLDVYA